MAVLAGAGLAASVGCSGQSPFLAGPTRGQMKASLAHLEYENSQIKRDLAKLRRDNREMEDRLVQQEQDNGDLTARLDDARNLLHDRGLEPPDRAMAGREHSTDETSGARTIPAGRSSRKGRRQPFARIPGQFSPAPTEEEPADEDQSLGPPQPASPSNPGTESDSTRLHFDDEAEPHTSYNAPQRWSPVAVRPGSTASRVR